jgi:hypothetical protein
MGIKACKDHKQSPPLEGNKLIYCTRRGTTAHGTSKPTGSPAGRAMLSRFQERVFIKTTGASKDPAASSLYIQQLVVLRAVVEARVAESGRE